MQTFCSFQKKRSSFAAGSYSTSSGCCNVAVSENLAEALSTSSGVRFGGGVVTRRTLPSNSARVGLLLSQMGDDFETS